MSVNVPPGLASPKTTHTCTHVHVHVVQFM